MFDTQIIQQVVTQFHFIRPLWLFAFVPMGALIWLRWRSDSQPNWKDLLPDHLKNALTIGDLGWRKQLPLKVLMVMVSLAIVICAGPTWQRQASPFGEDKASLLVVLDSSDSMLSKDLAPNRLERSKQKVRDLLTVRKGGNTGLVVYAGSAHIAMPMTQDNKVFVPFLAAISPSVMPVSGKQAEQALPLISEQLSGEKGSTVLLVTDGVTPATIHAYKDYFARNPYQLLVLAAGNARAQSDNPIDLDSLKELANQTGGRLIEVSFDNSDIETLERAIERNMQLNGDSAMPWKDMGYGLLVPLALIMLLWFRKGWLVQWCIVGGIVSSVYFTPTAMAQTVHTVAEQKPVVEYSVNDHLAQWWWDLWLTPDQQGQRWFDKKEYLKAAIHFTDPLRKGTAYYYASEFKLAHSAFLQASTPGYDSKAMTHDHFLGLYNAASALARQREYLAARDLLAYLANEVQGDGTLKRDIEHNLAVLSGIVEEVNRISESQIGTTEGFEESFELEEGMPQTGEGADEQTVAELMIRETLNANEILGSDELANKWLKRVEADPKYFLKTKFQIQLREQSHQGNKE